MDNGWSKTLLKQFIIFLCFTLIYTPSFAFSAEKWEVLENNYDHVTNKVKIEARKITQDAANSGRYKVEVPVSASTLGKSVKMMMWTGIAVEGVQAMLEGIGWIIDTGSKTIKRLKVKDPSTDPNLQYVWVDIKGEFHSTARSAANVTIAGLVADVDTRSYSYKYSTYPFNGSMDQASIVYSANHNNNSEFPVNVTRAPNPNYDPSQTPEPDYEVMSDSQLGEEILGKGENTSPIPAAVTDAYNPNNPVSDAPAPEATRQALDNANPQPEEEPKGESETEPETDPETGEATGKEKTTFELPNFCTWAPAVCDFFTVQKADNKDIKKNQREQIEQDKTFFEKVNDWFDWTKENDDLDQDNEPPEIEQIDIGSLDTGTFKATAGCPAPIQVPVTFGTGGNVTISYEPICQFADKWSFVAPLIGFLSGAMILVGVGRKGEDGEI